MDCCNFECNNEFFTSKKRSLRCGKCKRKSDYTCSSCGTQLSYPTRVRCDDCNQWLRNMKQMEDYVPKKRSNKHGCIKCHGPTEQDRYHSYCKDCQPDNYWFGGGKKTNNCGVCGIDIRGTGKHTFCSDKCYKVHRKPYLVELRKRQKLAKNKAYLKF